MPVSAPELFGVLSDPTTYPRWLTGTRRIRSVDDDFPRRTTQFEHEVGGGPLSVEDHTEVEDVQPNSRLELIVHARPFVEAKVVFEVISAGNGLARLRFSEELLGIYRSLSGLANPFLRFSNQRSLQRLRRYLEAGEHRRPAA